MANAELLYAGVGVGGQQPLLDVGEPLDAVGIRSHAVGDELVGLAHVGRPVEERHVDADVVHLGDEVIDGERQVVDPRREGLFDVCLAVHVPLDPAVLCRPESGFLQSVEVPWPGGVDESAGVAGHPVSLSPDGLLARRCHEKLEEAIELGAVLESASEAGILSAVGVSVVDHGFTLLFIPIRMM